MKADPRAQLTLLELQELDSRLAHLRHQQDHLPEHFHLAVAAETRADLDNRARDARIVVDDLSAEQAKIDADVEQVRARRTRDQDRMAQGLISNPKDLERMGHELQSLDRRISTLEDQELEIMEHLEEAQSTLTQLEDKLAACDREIAEHTSSRDQRVAELQAQLDELDRDRGPLVAELPTDLVALYDKLRATKDGVGAAALRARECGGCRLTIDNAELAEIRKAPEDDVIRCEECQRILVRTPESGL